MSSIHPQACIDPSAQLGDGVVVDAFCVVEAEARIGAGTHLGSHCHIGPGVVLGAECRLESACVILANSRLGNRCQLAAGVVIGSRGFGFVLDQGKHRPIPQVSGVEIGDDVVIGAGSCVDRGTLLPTRIESGVEIGAQVQIAHNVTVGERTRVAHQSGLAGSSSVGSDCELGLQSGVSGKMGDRSRLAVRGGLTRKAPPDSDLWGFPARPKAEALRATAALSLLAKRQDSGE